MQLTVRSWLLLMMTAPLIAGSGWLPPLLWAAGAWLLLAAALLIVDAQLMPRANDWRLERRHDARLSLAAQNRIRIVIELLPSRRTTLRPVPIWLRDTPPPTFRLDRPEPLLTGVAPPNGLIE
ncbi:MAG: hypothetical protein CUN48_18535, partial [Candidatus Thermofonsia Clade 3 bacterium]